MPTQVLQFPFTGSLEQHQAAEVLDPGAWTRLDGLVCEKGGTLQKGFGLTAESQGLAQGGNVPAGQRLISFKNEQLLVDGNTLYTYSPTEGAWRTVDQVPQPQASRQSIVQSPGTIGAWDVAYCNGYIIVATRVITGSTHRILCTILDATNGAIVLAPQTVVASAFGANLKLVAFGTTVWLLYDDNGSTSNIFWKGCNLNSASDVDLGFVLSGTLLTTLGAAGMWDAFAGTDRFWVLWSNNSGTNNSLSLQSWNASVVTITGPTTTNVAATSLVSLALGGNQSDRIFMAYASAGAGANSIVVIGVNPTTHAVTSSGAALIAAAASISSMGVCWTATGAGTVVVNETNIGLNAEYGLYSRTFTTVAGGVTAGPGVRKNFRLLLASRPFLANGRVYAAVNHIDASPRLSLGAGGDFQRMTMLVDLTATYSTARVVAAPAARLATFAPNSVPANVAVTAGVSGTPRYLWLIGTLKSALSNSVDLVTLDFSNSSPAWQPAPYGELLGLSGGVGSLYDGAHVTELGFLVWPEIQGTAGTPNDFVVDGGAAGNVNGTVSYTYVYEGLDARGWVAIGAPGLSIPTVTPGSSTATTFNQITVANRKVTCWAPTLQITSRQDTANPDIPVRIAIYRTKSTDNLYRRVGTVMNDPTVNLVSFTDNTADSGLGAFLYTQPSVPGGVLPRFCPPALPLLITHGERLIGAADDGLTLWVSGQLVYGEEPWFHENLNVTVTQGGAITGLASMDGRLVVFKRDAIAYIDGQGPPDGGGPGFSDPAFIATTVGCIEPRSIVVTPEGCVFKSLRGLEKLNRAMQVEGFFGQPVEDSTATYPNMVGAVHDEVNGRVHFLCHNGAVSNAIITWDYVTRVWSTRTFVDPDGTNALFVSGALVSSSGTPTVSILMTSGRVYLASTTNFYDVSGGTSSWVTATVETPWIKLTGIQGYQRIRRVTLLAKKQSTHGMKMELAFDYSASYDESRTWTSSEINALTREQLQKIVGNQKCQAIRIRITDQVPAGGDGAGDGRSAQFIALALEYEAKARTFRVPAAAR